MKAAGVIGWVLGGAGVAMGAGGLVEHSSMVAESTGASLAWTSAEPTVVRARALLAEGRLAEAEALLKTGAGAPSSISDAAAEMLDVIGRIRAGYSLDAGTLLARIRETVPDATAEDVERWRALGQVQCRVIDGQIAYFAREPANLFRFCPEARRRRDAAAREPASAADGWRLDEHLTNVMAAATTSPAGRAALVVPVRHRVRYAITIHAGAPGLRPGAVVRAWLPMPQEHARQSDVRLIRTDPAPATIAPARSAPQRTVYLERRLGERGGREPVRFEAEVAFTSIAEYPAIAEADCAALPADWTGGELGERPPHIVFSPLLRQTVAGVVGDERNPLARARRIFRYVVEHVAYDAEEEYGTIPSLSERALRSGRGDCGVQAMLFITMCRCAGIPARWQSGWQTRPGRVDMHDWAEFYVALRNPPRPDESGAAAGARPPGVWLPADPSYAQEFVHHPDPRLRDFYFGHIDSYRMIVNLDYGAPLVPARRSLRSEPLDFQRGEVEVDGGNLYYGAWDYDIEVEYPDSSTPMPVPR